MGTEGSATAEPRFPFLPDEPLLRVPELTIRLQSDGSVVFGEGGYQFGPHTLRVLEIFSKPTSFREALAALQPSLRGSQDWVDLSDTIRGLCTLGILDTVDRSSRKPASRVGFDAPVEHIHMLNDRARTNAYLRAIPEVVRPGDVVVEIGTGSGILSMAAARAGARHVYTIEAGAIGAAAAAVFEANGLSDRITLVPGLSTHVTLPERGDVLLSEIIGNEPLDERVLESTRDAIQRLLKPEARFIPRSLSIYAVPVQIPAPILAGYFFVESARSRWKDWYGMDFDPLVRGNATSPVRIALRPHVTRDWVRASPPALMADIDLSSGHPPKVDSHVQVNAVRGGPIHGIVTYFDLELAADVALSTDPGRVDEGSSWRLPVLLLPAPLEVEPGETLTLRYEYPSSHERRVSISGGPRASTEPRLGEKRRRD